MTLSAGSAVGWESDIIEPGIAPALIFGVAGLIEILSARRMWQTSVAQNQVDLETEQSLFNKYFGEADT